MRKIKLLIVEDEAMLALLLSRTLRLMGYEVCGSVATGLTAVKAALDHNPDVILMDIKLAGAMDGIEAAKRIIAQSKIPIIFMTGYSDDSILERADALQPAAFLVKPVTPEHIVPVLQALFQN